LTSSQKDPSG